jgi:hypothetical protein
MTMAKETKRKSRTAMTPYRGGGPMERRGRKGGKGKRSGGGGKQSTETRLKNAALGGAIVGFLTKPGGVLAPGSSTLANIPGHDKLGGEGVLAIAAQLIGKGKPGMLTSVGTIAAGMAVANFVKTGLGA